MKKIYSWSPYMWDFLTFVLPARTGGLPTNQRQQQQDLKTLVLSARTGGPSTNQRQQQLAGGARPTAGRPPAQVRKNQNAGGGDANNAGGDGGHINELNEQVMTR